ncbi:aspartate aminotransferase family protein [Micromonospora sp. KC606]|uniref:pyridoxal phosphate-dependent decarboxylase family protein n=1 Tax=Micromonospora sp. KC606 TaxID=2530379 RepID=UPI0010534C02|nr:pyridoxal-dependent decarboxylase [Micromonospora sp. KC606]TDC83971.1 aspartate aminotransferase family protein [Micromonospora sp. KC606]
MAAFQDDSAAALRVAAEYAHRYLLDLTGRPVSHPEPVVSPFDRPLPAAGLGAEAAVRLLGDGLLDAATRSSGPRYFHFVTGGTTPAALAADWLTSVADQNGAAWVCSPFAARAETAVLDWLQDLFELPGGWDGVLTTGATMANCTGIAAARRWWGLRHGIDVDADGLAGLPQMPVFGGGYVHASAVKSLDVLGIGRSSLRRFARPDGRLDPAALSRELAALGGAPALILATAGETDTGDFDPIAELAEMAREHGAWLHIDGAFGLFSRLSPRTAGLTTGLEQAHSVAADGHKWLNVPYDCGFAFVRERGLLGSVFTNSAAYLVDPDDPHPIFSNVGPDNSRRVRAFAAWATLAAYGRDGYRAMVEHHLDLAGQLAAAVEAAPDFELLAPATLNVVCFRYRPPGVTDEEADRLNTALGSAVLDDGRVHLGTTRHRGRVAFRPAFVNWRTTASDVAQLPGVLRQLAGKLDDAS